MTLLLAHRERAVIAHDHRGFIMTCVDAGALAVHHLHRFIMHRGPEALGPGSPKIGPRWVQVGDLL